jgi:hypothetical protein
VASIIHQIAPGAQIFSIKVMDRTGDLMSLITGMYLAETFIQPHIYNLSLKVECDGEKCRKCGYFKHDPYLEWQTGQLFSAFQQSQIRFNAAPLIVAAAGNYTEKLPVPARLPSVLAVGAFDFGRGTLADYCQYRSIVPDRFILAPGGTNAGAEAIAMKSGFGREGYYGTSFAAAFVSGVAARYACQICFPTGIDANYIWHCLNGSANRDFPGYQINKHGMGLVKYDLHIRAALPEHLEFYLQTPTPAIHTIDDLRLAVQRKAYDFWQQKGQPQGDALSHWLRAKQEVGVPEDLVL